MKKQCIKCGEWKLLSEFCKARHRKDGLRSDCKKCKKIYNKEYERTHKIEIKNRKEKHRKTIIGNLVSRFHTILKRCNNPNAINYKDYGGRGIKCLFGSSDEFVNYVINELQIDPRGLTIDRIDNDGNYELGNIQFVTQAENNKNKRKYKN